MKYLLIQNKGEIDVEALSLMGASTKRGDDSKIGYFGSGNKYAIAVLLRLGIPFKIFSGETEIEVKATKREFRNREFDQISFIVNGAEIVTSLTVQMGPQWEPWFAIREIYCNAMDEGGMQMVAMQDMNGGCIGNTRFYVGITKEIEPVISNWNGYFCNDRIDMLDEIPGIRMYIAKGDGLRIYRKGVLVYHNDHKHGVFDYDIDNVTINESRQLADLWTTRWEVEKKITTHAKSPIINRILLGLHASFIENKSLWESEMDFTSGMYDNRAEWEKAVDGYTIINATMADNYPEEKSLPNALLLPGTLVGRLVEKVKPELDCHGVPRPGLKHSFKEYEATEQQLIDVNTAMQYMIKAGFDMSAYTVEIVKFDNYKICAMTNAVDKIYIGLASLERGVRFIAMALLEEVAHIQSKMTDETRGFEEYLMTKWMNEIEGRMGYAL